MSHINDAVHGFYHIDWKEALLDGSLLTSHYDVALGAGASAFVGFITGPSPVILQSRGVDTDSDLYHLEIFQGGAYSAGAALDQHRRNLVFDTTAGLFSDLKGGITIDTPGTSIFHVEVLGVKNLITTDVSEAPSFIFEANTTYYYLLRNDSAQSRDYHFRLTHSRFN